MPIGVPRRTRVPLAGEEMLTCGATLPSVSVVVLTTSGCRLSLALRLSVQTASSLHVTVVVNAAALPKVHVVPASTPDSGVALQWVTRLGPSGSETWPASATALPS